MSESDKRGSRRVSLDVYLNKFIRGVPYMARAKDISRDGIYLTQLLEPDGGDDRIGVQFQLPGCREVIYAEGRIVREADGRAVGNGIRFTTVSTYHRRLIDRYIQRKQPRAA